MPACMSKAKVFKIRATRSNKLLQYLPVIGVTSDQRVSQCIPFCRLRDLVKSIGNLNSRQTTHTCSVPRLTRQALVNNHFYNKAIRRRYYRTLSQVMTNVVVVVRRFDLNFSQIKKPVNAVAMCKITARLPVVNWGIVVFQSLAHSFGLPVRGLSGVHSADMQVVRYQ